MYGSLVWGLFPGKVGMSWEGHLSGFIVGLALALIYKTKHIVKPKYEWEKKDYDSKDDEFMQLFDEDGNFIPDMTNEVNDENKDDEETEIVYYIKEQKDKNQ